MTTFDERLHGFEAKFAHDEELRFRATARRDRMLGMWASEKLGRTGADAEAYAREVIRADLREGHEREVFRKIREDFDAAGVPVSDREIQQTMIQLMARAIAEVEASP